MRGLLLAVLLPATTAATETLFDLFGISQVELPGLDDSQLKKLYKRRALELHPDKSDHPDAEDRFRRLQEAYDFKCGCRLCTSTSLDGLLRCPRGPPEEAIKCLDGAWTALSVDNNEAADEIGRRADDAWRALPPTHGFKLQLDLLRITTKARLRASDLDLRCRMFLGALAVSPELTVAATDPLTRARVLFLGGMMDEARALAVLCLGPAGARAAFPN